MMFIYAQNLKNLQNKSFLFDLRNNAISNLCGKLQCKSITIRLTDYIRSSKVSKRFDLVCSTLKNCFFINVHSVKYLLSCTYWCPNSTKTENQTLSNKKVTKKEKPLNLDLAVSSKVKSLAFPVSLS